MVMPEFVLIDLPDGYLKDWLKVLAKLYLGGTANPRAWSKTFKGKYTSHCHLGQGITTWANNGQIENPEKKVGSELYWELRTLKISHIFQGI